MEGKDEMEVILKDTVTFQGREAKAGEILDLPERSAKSLAAAGLAEYPAGEKQNGTSDALSNQGGINPPGDNTSNGREAVAKLSKALDDQYKRDELAAAAKEAGVEFMYDAKKSEIIEAVIEQGKEAALLK